MKIEINYDLLDKIREAKTGFSLDKTVNPVMVRTIIASSLYTLLNINDPNLLDKVLSGVPFLIVFFTGPIVIPSIIMKNKFKDMYIHQLKLLSLLLNDINISTSYELLLDSDNYKTEYKFKFNESKIPYIKEDKYINIPTYDDSDIRDVSLVQEHVIGSKKYSLSYGAPKKILKPAFSAT